MATILEGAELQHSGMVPEERVTLQTNAAMSSLFRQLGPSADRDVGKAILDYARSMGMVSSKNKDTIAARSLIERSVIRPMNDRAAMVRNYEAWVRDPNYLDNPALAKTEKAAIKKASLDVGHLTDFASITGGQSLGYVSLDTRMARGTVRPNSFTIYQSLEKSLAWQIVDYWAIATATGGAIPGAAFANFTSVSSGSLTTNAGSYQLSNITLKLAVDGRAITTALAAQNNFVNVSEQETTNAALSVLMTDDWSCYWGDSTLYSNQFDGIYSTLVSNSLTRNIYDFQTFYNNNAASHSWSAEQTLYNLIYEAAGQITKFGTFGKITHAFMSPVAMGALQSLPTTLLNNIVNQLNDQQDRNPLVINGNLIGIQTRYGHIQFPMDMFIDARDRPAEAIPNASATSSAPTPPTSVIPTILGATAGSEWSGSYVAGGAVYMYAATADDSSSVESTTVYSSGTIPAPAAGGAINVALVGNADTAVFRVYRSGLGYTQTSTPSPTKFRYVGCIKANGATPVNFVDLNGGSGTTALLQHGGTFLPGSTTIFLLDMDPIDLAIDYRMMLPLVRIDLFANNLFMPWAVANIGSIRLRVPQFHGMIKNYVPTNPEFNPLASNYP